jgi:hypothetical protein
MKPEIDAILNGRSLMEISEEEAEKLKPLSSWMYDAWVNNKLEESWEQLSDEDKERFAPALWKELGFRIDEYPKWYTREETQKRMAAALTKIPLQSVEKRPKFTHKPRKLSKQINGVRRTFRSNPVLNVIDFIVRPHRWGILYKHQMARYRYKKMMCKHIDSIKNNATRHTPESIALQIERLK